MRHLLGYAALAFVFSMGTANATMVKEVVSPGGIKAWLVEEHALPLIAIKISFTGSGYAYDPGGKEGRANMAAALLMEGAGGMDSQAFNKAIESLALRINTSVDDDMFQLAMESLSEHKNKALEFAGLMLREPRFDTNAIERVKSQTLSLLTQQEQDPGYKLYWEWKKRAFGSHGYGKPQIGTRGGISSVDRDDLKKFTERYFTRSNIVIAVVGDITADELGKLLDAHLKDLPEKYDPDSTVSEIETAAGGEPAIIEFDIPQTMVAFGARGVKRDHPGYFAAYVMNHILGGGGSLTARLGEEIREKRGLAYSVYSGLDPMAHAASWRGGFATRNEQAMAAYDVLKASLKDFVDNGPTDKELTDAKQYLIDSFVLNLDSNADIASFLIVMQTYKLGIDYFDRRNAMVASVRKKDVHDMAKQLIDPDKLLTVMIGKPQKP